MKTKIFTLLLLATILLPSCGSYKPIFMGTYPQSMRTEETSKSVDEVWSKVIDFFASEGIAINIIDKSSGLITSERTPFTEMTTEEDGKGNLINPNAYIVAVPLAGGFGNKLPLDNGRYNITASWNVRVKNIDGKTSITVNVVNLTGSYQNPTSKFSSSGTIVPVQVKSTGVFEESILNLLK